MQTFFFFLKFEAHKYYAKAYRDLVETLFSTPNAYCPMNLRHNVNKRYRARYLST